jgi:proline iminopeptidase
MNPDPAIHMPAAIAWSLYEGSCSTLVPDPEELKSFAGDVLALGLARMETHYFRNDIFLPENFLLDNIHRIRRIPTFIVQGRYDLVCPIRTADDLTQLWPEARYEIIADAGHAKAEPGIRKALLDGMDRFRNLG